MSDWGNLIDSGKDVCYLAWHHILDFNLPEWTCRDLMIYEHPPLIEYTFNLDSNLVIPGVLGLICAGSLGFGFVHFCETEIQQIFDPICDWYEKRRTIVMELDRLITMNGHP